jgi:hypothetical protein
MYISSTAVHRIVASAFHGSQPSQDHVVDHIDINRSNNRPENLRWVTRLENILLNPISRRKVEIAYGSIEKFIENPSAPLPGKLTPNFEWMRTVTKQEAEDSYNRLMEWAQSNTSPSGGVTGEWLYSPQQDQNLHSNESSSLIDSKTKGAVQNNWKTPSEFPNCPSPKANNGLIEYCQRLKEGEVFARNDFSKSIVLQAKLSEDNDELFVICNIPKGVKKWALSKVTLNDQFFIHENLRTFFELKSAEKELTIALGLEWKGGDTIDDYC